MFNHPSSLKNKFPGLCHPGKFDSKRVYQPPQHSKISFPWCQEFVITILGHTKNNKSINKVFKMGNHSVPTAMNSWQQEILIGEKGNQWSDIFRIANSANRDVNMKMFQFKILHRILATNKKLKQFRIIDSDLCDFCGLETESIIHIFCECEVTTPIWQHISRYQIRLFNTLSNCLWRQKLGCGCK